MTKTMTVTKTTTTASLTASSAASTGVTKAACGKTNPTFFKSLRGAMPAGSRVAPLKTTAPAPASTTAAPPTKKSKQQQPAAVVVKSSGKSLRETLQLDRSPSSPRMFGTNHPAPVTPERALVVPRPVTPTPTADASTRRPLVIGHRGAVYDALENTRDGFLKCAQWGVDGVELDVFLLKCGTLAVFHGGGTDQNPGDLTDYCLNQSGKSILDLTYAEALELEFNTHYKGYPCAVDDIRKARIPTLEEVLTDLKPSKTLVKIELKGKGTPARVLELVERLEMVGQCHFGSFQHDLLKEVRQLRPQIDPLTKQYVFKTAAIFGVNVPTDYIQQARAIRASEIHLRYDTCTVERITAIHQNGFKSMAWFRGPAAMHTDMRDIYKDVGNEDDSCYQALLDTGVDQICCNRPNILLNLMKKKGMVML